jgi:cytidylate kinase
MREPAHRHIARLEHCTEFARSQSQSPRRTKEADRGRRRPLITISREAGTDAHAVADAIVATMEARASGGAGSWAVFDRNIVDTVLETHGLPPSWAEFMPEDRVSAIGDALEELFGLHPSSWTLVRRTTETIRRLADIGNVVLIGRGAAVIAGDLDHAFHVRLVGSLEGRIRRVQQEHGLGPEAASEYVRSVDAARARYVKKYYGKDVGDPLLYHMVLNVDRLSADEAARVVADTVCARAADPPPPVVGIDAPGRDEPYARTMSSS